MENEGKKVVKKPNYDKQYVIKLECFQKWTILSCEHWFI